jgi:hypothetical protein
MKPVFSVTNENKIYGGGFTLETLQNTQSIPSIYVGGSSSSTNNQFSDMFASYAVPLGLLSNGSAKIYQFGGKKENVKEEGMTPTSLHEKLLALVQERRVKREKTKKQRESVNKPKKEPKNKTKKNYD